LGTSLFISVKPGILARSLNTIVSCLSSRKVIPSEISVFPLNPSRITCCAGIFTYNDSAVIRIRKRIIGFDFLRSGVGTGFPLRHYLDLFRRSSVTDSPADQAFSAGQNLQPWQDLSR